MKTLTRDDTEHGKEYVLKSEAVEALSNEREVYARLCDQIADDLIAAMQKEGETDDEYMKNVVASARVCAEEIRAEYRA